MYVSKQRKPDDQDMYDIVDELMEELGKTAKDNEIFAVREVTAGGLVREKIDRVEGLSRGDLGVESHLRPMYNKDSYVMKSYNGSVGVVADVVSNFRGSLSVQIAINVNWEQSDGDDDFNEAFSEFLEEIDQKLETEKIKEYGKGFVLLSGKDEVSKVIALHKVHSVDQQSKGIHPVDSFFEGFISSIKSKEDLIRVQRINERLMVFLESNKSLPRKVEKLKGGLLGLRITQKSHVILVTATKAAIYDSRSNKLIEIYDTLRKHSLVEAEKNVKKLKINLLIPFIRIMDFRRNIQERDA